MEKTIALIYESSLNLQAGNGKCSCAGMTVDGVSVKPIKGDAVLFWSMVRFKEVSLVMLEFELYIL